MGAVVERRISIADFKAKISEYSEAVHRGETLIVTRYNRPVFKVSPVEPLGAEPHCRGILAEYVDPGKIPLEEGAWGKDVVRRAADFV